MKLLLLLLTLLHSTAVRASQIVDLSDAANMTWSLSVPDISRMPHNNHYKLFHDVLVCESGHTLALLRWRDFAEDHPTRCNLTLRSHGFGGEVGEKVCDVEPPPAEDSDWVFAESVSFLRADRVLVSWREKHKTKGLRVTSQVIFTDSCRSSGYIHVRTSMYYASTAHIVTTFRERFDIVFSDKALCPDDVLCKLSFSHEGAALANATATPFSAPFVRSNESLLVDSIHAMSQPGGGGGEGLVLTGSKNYMNLDMNVMGDTLASTSPDVYSPLLGWTEAPGLFDPQHVYSNSSGFASICWSPLRSDHLHCKWLDGTHVNADDGSQFTLTLRMQHPARMPARIINTPDGRILLLADGYDHEYEARRLLFVDVAHGNGKCERLLGVVVVVEDTIKRVELSIVVDGATKRYCMSFVTVESDLAMAGERTHRFRYKFASKCVRAPEPRAQMYITCGRNWF